MLDHFWSPPVSPNKVVDNRSISLVSVTSNHRSKTDRTALTLLPIFLMAANAKTAITKALPSARTAFPVGKASHPTREENSLQLIIPINSFIQIPPKTEIHPPFSRYLGSHPALLCRRPQPLLWHPTERPIPQPPSWSQPSTIIRRSGHGPSGGYCR